MEPNAARRTSRAARGSAGGIQAPHLIGSKSRRLPSDRIKSGPLPIRYGTIRLKPATSQRINATYNTPPLQQLDRPEVETFGQVASADPSRSCGMGLGATLRVFLRYCAWERILPTNLSATVGLPQRYRLADTPRAIPRDAMSRLLEFVEPCCADRCRDYATLLLLITYVMRVPEKAALNLGRHRPAG